MSASGRHSSQRPAASPVAPVVAGPATVEAAPFALTVGLVGDKPERFVFDQSRVTVGRGLGCDLRIEHGALSRQQFTVERGMGSAGEPRFRLTPFATTNPTLVNDHPAVEGQLLPGDVVAVGEIRLRLAVGLKERGKAEKKERSEASPVRLLLITLCFGLAAFVGYLYLGSGDAGDGDGLNASTPLFPPRAPSSIKGGDKLCGNPLECAGRAHDAESRGKKLMQQASADPGNYYRATLELERAQELAAEAKLTGGGNAVADLDDLAAQHDRAQAAAEQAFADAKFRMARAAAAGDNRRAKEEADLLSRIVPDPQHPYRISLDAYRRGLGASAATPKEAE